MTEKLTNEQIHEKITKLNNMRAFYNYTQKYELLNQVNDMIEGLYVILDERMQEQFFDENIGRETGIVLDNMKNSEQEKKDEKPKRKRGFGSII